MRSPPVRLKGNQLQVSFSASPPVSALSAEKNVPEQMEVRRAMSTLQDEFALRARVSDLEGIIVSMKKSEATQEEDKRNFRKKVSNYEDDPRMGELIARNRELEQQLIASRTEIRKPPSDSPERDGLVIMDTDQ